MKDERGFADTNIVAKCNPLLQDPLLHFAPTPCYPLNPSSEPDPVRRSSRCDGGCRRAMRAPTVGIKRARYATPSTVAPAWSAKRCENARHQDSLRIAQALRRATQSALPVLHTALSGRDSGS